MGKKLYVGGLSFNTSDAALKEAFEQAGEVVSATIIVDRATGRSKGFGFVEMGTEADAQKAIQLFHGQKLDGRTLTVNVARPMESRPRRDEGNGGGGGRGGPGQRSFSGGRRESW